MDVNNKIGLPPYYQHIEKSEVNKKKSSTVEYEVIQNKKFIPFTFYKPVSQVWSMKKEHFRKIYL